MSFYPGRFLYKGQVLNQVAAYMLNAQKIFVKTGLWILLLRTFQLEKNVIPLKLKW